MKRNTFIKTAGITAAGLTILPSFTSRNFINPGKVRVAIIGTGLRGQDHLDLLLRRDDTDVVAICDIEERMLADAIKLFEQRDKPNPKIITGDKYAWKKILDIPGLEGVIIATPWEWHTEMIVAAI